MIYLIIILQMIQDLSDIGKRGLSPALDLQDQLAFAGLLEHAGR